MNLLVAIVLLCVIKFIYDDIQKRGLVLLNEGLLECSGLEFNKILLIFVGEGLSSLVLLIPIKLHYHKLLPKLLLVACYLLI